MVEAKHSQGSAPTISINGGGKLYLSNDSLGASKTAAKLGEDDVLVPGGNDEDDWVYLTNDDLGASITTSKSGEISVLVPCGNAEDNLDVKSVKEERVSTLKNSVLAEVASSVSVESGSSLDGKYVTEVEIRAVLLQETPVTTQKLVTTFKSRLRSQEARDAFSAILRRISKLQVTTGGSKRIVLKV